MIKISQENLFNVSIELSKRKLKEMGNIQLQELAETQIGVFLLPI